MLFSIIRERVLDYTLVIYILGSKDRGNQYPHISRPAMVELSMSSLAGILTWAYGVPQRLLFDNLQVPKSLR